MEAAYVWNKQCIMYFQFSANRAKFEFANPSWILFFALYKPQ